jgi:hypothetical protein
MPLEEYNEGHLLPPVPEALQQFRVGQVRRGLTLTQSP